MLLSSDIQHHHYKLRGTINKHMFSVNELHHYLGGVWKQVA